MTLITYQIKCENWSIKQPGIVFAELDLEAVYSKTLKAKRFEPVSGYPSIVRDVSLAVKNDTTFEQVKEIAVNSATDILRSVKFNELYLGEKINREERGLVFSLIYQSPKRTLTEEEVNKVHSKILQLFVSKLNATIR